jgi:hypothetical protein
MTKIDKVRRLLESPEALAGRIWNVEQQLGKTQIALGLSQLKLNKLLGLKDFQSWEFQVFSQSSEDGILQWILDQMPQTPKTFVEFGVETYTEANTRFLAEAFYWSGLVIDGSESNVAFIQADTLYWRRNLKAVASFITKDNINKLIQEHYRQEELGILSVDIDGNDYWIWEAISSVKPKIVVCEYNRLFGAKAEVSVPYKADFIRSSEHFSHVYYGASAPALVSLARKKKMKLVALNSFGNNLFFVEESSPIPEIRLEAFFPKTCFREARNAQGDLAFASDAEARSLIAEMPLWDLQTGKTIKVRELGL